MSIETKLRLAQASGKLSRVALWFSAALLLISGVALVLTYSPHASAATWIKVTFCGGLGLLGLCFLTLLARVGLVLFLITRFSLGLLLVWMLTLGAVITCLMQFQNDKPALTIGIILLWIACNWLLANQVEIKARATHSDNTRP